MPNLYSIGGIVVSIAAFQNAKLVRRRVFSKCEAPLLPSLSQSTLHVDNDTDYLCLHLPY